MQMRNYQSEPSPTRGFALERFSLDSIYYTLAELYNADLGLQSGLFVFAPDLFEVLDGDDNQRVTQRELAGLPEARPDVVVRVDYSLDAAPQLSLIKLADSLKLGLSNTERDEWRKLEVKLAEFWPSLEFVFAEDLPTNTTRATTMLRRNVRPIRRDVLTLLDNVKDMQQASQRQQLPTTRPNSGPSSWGSTPGLGARRERGN